MSDADADEGGENDDDHDDNDDDTNDDDDDDADDDEEDAEVGNPNPGWPPEAAGFCGIFGRYSPPFSQGVRHERARRSRRPGGHGFRPCCNCSHSRPRHFEAEFFFLVACQCTQVHVPWSLVRCILPLPKNEQLIAG